MASVTEALMMSSEKESRFRDKVRFGISMKDYYDAVPAPWAGNGGPGLPCESLVPALDEPAE